MRLVIIESAYAGDVDANVDYARRCVRDCLSRGESPIASHLLFTQPGVLDDDDALQRNLGICAGLAWYRVAQRCVVYLDRGLTPGMRRGIEAAEAACVTVEYRRLEAR